MKTALESIRQVLKKAPLTQIITFVMITMFLAVSSPVISFGATTSSSSSGTSTNKSSFDYWLDNAEDSILNQTTQIIVGSNDYGDTQEYSSSTSLDDNIEYKGGAMQELASMGEYMYSNQPASAIVWAQEQVYLAKSALNMDVSAASVNSNETSTYSPGTGYEILQSVKGLWQLSANIVYALLMVILIIVAFLIILRRPLGGKEMVTLANSIPSIVVTLILVVFSYALCGLFIDAIYLGSNVSYNLLIGNESSPGYGLTEKVAVVDQYGKSTGETTNIKNILQPDDPQMSIWNMFSLSGGNVCARIPDTSSTSSDDSTKMVSKCSFSYIIPATWQSNALGIAIDNLIKSLNDTGINVQNSLMELILALAVFQTAFKLFMELLQSYLTLSFYPIIAPFVFLQGALPGGTMKALDQFFKTLGAASLNFIVIYTCFLLLVIFGHTSVDSSNNIEAAYKQAGQVQWVPPLLGYSEEQIYGLTTPNNNGSNIITALLIFGLYMAMPNLIAMIKKFMETSSPFAQLANTGKDMARVSKETMGYIGAGAKVLAGNFFGS